LLRTRFLSRNVVLVNRVLCYSFCFLLFAGCARLPALTPAILEQAEQKWDAHKPAEYRLVIEMSGDRVETGRFEVLVHAGQVVSFRRNGLVLAPERGQDYSMEGLFRVLEQELGLAEKPSMLGAPEGYTIYTTAKFDEITGRLVRYRRIVGGASNSIDIDVMEYEENPK
jgi:hypothetical protein